MDRRSFQVSGLVLALLWADAIAGEVSRPHIHLIRVDDHGYGDLSSFGAPDLRTPPILRELETALRTQIQRGGRVPWQPPRGESP